MTIHALKLLLAINIATLAMNGIVVWLTLSKVFPAAFGMLLFLAGLAGAVWLSCYVNGALPYQRHRPPSFYSAPTEKVERI